VCLFLNVCMCVCVRVRACVHVGEGGACACDMYGTCSLRVHGFVLLLTCVVVTHNIFVQNIYLMHTTSLQTLDIAL
jgi:hypothetical protein